MSNQHIINKILTANDPVRVQRTSGKKMAYLNGSVRGEDISHTSLITYWYTGRDEIRQAVEKT